MKRQAAVGTRLSRLWFGQKTENRGMNLWAKFALVTLCTFLVSTFMSGGWCGPQEVEAAAVTRNFQKSNGVSVGIDGNTNWVSASTTKPILDLMGTAVPTTGYTQPALTTTPTVVYKAYSPAIAQTTTIAAGSTVTLNVREAAAITCTETVTVNLYDYTPGGTAGNGTLIGTATQTTAALGITNTNMTFTLNNPLYPLIASAGTPKRLRLEVVASTTAAVNFRINSGTGTVSRLVTDETAIVASSSPLLHNSVNLDPTNLKGYGVWGVAGGTYGEFVCETCHSSATTGLNGNIKKVVASIPATIGNPVVKPVYFYNMTGFGNDSVSHPVSTKICEVCHTQTSAHQYNSTRTPDMTHGNGDCTGCHPHATAFKAIGHQVPLYATTAGHTNCASGIGCHTNSNPLAPYPTTGSPAPPPDCRVCHKKDSPTIADIGCGSCHGVNGGDGQPSGAAFPNWSGSHTVHTAAQPLCTACHTSGGTGGDADHGQGNRNTNPAVVNLNATYGWTGAATKTCSNATCHANPYVVSGFVASPVWGTTGNGCNACHSANPITVNGPATGNHINVAGHAVACTQCHATGTAPTTAATLANGHTDGDIDVANVGYPPNKTKGTAGATCSAATCHGNVYGTGSVPTPAWGAPVTNSCTICHDTYTIGAGGPATGSHAVHAGKACTSCHAAGTTATSGPTSGHADGNIDVVNITYTPNITKHPAGSGYSTCSNITCHSAYVVVNNTATWGMTATCATCHPQASLSGAHQVHMGELNLASGSVFYNMTANHSPAVADSVRRTHGFGCAECHPMAKANHLNGTIDVDLNRVNVAGVGSLRFLNASTAAYHMDDVDPLKRDKCSNIYCHSNASRIDFESNVNANTSLAWTDTYAAHELADPNYDRCAQCHGNQPTTGAHVAHAVSNHSNNIYNGKDGKVGFKATGNSAHGNPNTTTTITCYICHTDTVSAADDKHGNDKNDKCNVCHGNASPDTSKGYVTAPLKGTAAISNLANHVNGKREIKFPSIKVRSKAQVRPESFKFYSGVWKRNYYKNMTSIAFDESKLELHTATMWHYSSAKYSNCSNLACHNGYKAVWNVDNANDPNKCMDCHFKL